LSNGLEQAMSSTTLADALAHHRAGRFQDAEVIYRQILAADPNYPDALHLLGLIAQEAGRHDAALDLIGRAIARRPEPARSAKCPRHGRYTRDSRDPER